MIWDGCVNKEVECGLARKGLFCVPVCTPALAFIQCIPVAVYSEGNCQYVFLTKYLHIKF